jgi:hypothetical protein
MRLLKSTRNDISEMEDKWEEFRFHRQRSTWTQLGDRCNVDFFKMVHPKFCKTAVKQFKRADGILTTVPDEMRQVATDFFRDLLSAEALSKWQDLAILLVDFEKAYDRVDWGFLEGMLLCFGFSDKWVKGIAALYSSMTSWVLLAGHEGPSFRLTRFVRQGCHLPSFYFCFSQKI